MRRWSRWSSKGLVSYLVVITNGKKSWDGVDNTVVLVIGGWHGIDKSQHATV